MESKNMKYFTFFVGLALFLLTISIRCNTNKNPLSSKDNTNIILNSSFEENGHQSLKYWYVDSTQIPYFDTDVPPGGGKWSIYLEASWYGPLPKSPSYLLPLSSGKHILNLSLWGKYKSVHGSAFLIQKNKDMQNMVGKIVIEDTTWTKYSFIDTVQLNTNDSLLILLYGGGTEVVPGKTHFDLVEVKLIDE